MATREARRSFLGTFLLVFLAIALLFVADTFLARTERVESASEAARFFAEGRALMKRGSNAEAIERLRDAELIDRANRGYQRTLAEAQLAAGKTADAESTLADLLESDSTDAAANLLMGRVLVKEDRFTDAVSYFHRAIYGRWKEDAAGNRLRTRFELIDLLAAHGSKEDLLAELLEVQDQAPQDPKTRMRMGKLFMVAGSPARAAAVFQRITHDNPSDADAHRELGEAEFAQGDYRDAEREFSAAMRLAPDDGAIRQRVQACDEILMLDPTIRGLSAAERFRRSRHLVELTKDETSHCAGANPSTNLQASLDKAGAALKTRTSAAGEGEGSESDLDLAARLWQTRKKECKSPPDQNSPLALVMARLAQ